MVQLIINGTTLPETKMDKYKAWREDLGKNARMAAGNDTYEKRGQVQHVSYEYDYFKQPLLDTVLTALRSGEQLYIQYLLENGTYATGYFRCYKFPRLSYAWSRADRAYWHGIDFELEGVDTV